MSLYKGVSDQVLALTLLDWHSGGGSPLYVVGSAMYAGHRAPIDQVRLALADLRTMYEVAVDDGEPEADDLSSLYDELSKRYADELASRNPGALGPSLDYAHNYPEGGIPPGSVEHEELGDDGLAFSMQTCDHTELDPLVIEEIDSLKEEARETGVVPETGSLLVDEQLQVEIIGEDQGPLPPPWARFAETFGVDFEMTLPAEKSIFEEAVDFQEAQHLLAANPRKPIPLATEFAERLRAGERFSARQLGISGTNILATNPKLSKGGGVCLISTGLPLAPWGISGVTNLCPYASKGCAFGCLNVSGHGELGQTAPEARKRRTMLFMYNRPDFAMMLERGMKSWQKIADLPTPKWSPTLRKRLGEPSSECLTHNLVVRMNVLSDLPWEQIKLTWPDGQVATWPERYPQHQFYDYTKNPDRMMRFMQYQNGAPVDWPPNYYLTFSWSEINAAFAFHVLDQGGNVALPFDTSSKVDDEALPPIWCGYPVIDADQHDMRFLDNEEHADLRREFATGVICGLRLKGTRHTREYWERYREERQQKLPVGTLTGGFVQSAQDAGMRGRGKKAVYDESLNITLNPEYKAMLIELAEQRAREQAQDPHGWQGKGFRGLSLRAHKVLE